MHDQGPALLRSLLHQAEGDLPAEDRAQVPHPVEVQVLAQIVGQVVFVQMQLRAVDEIRAGRKDPVLFFMEAGLKLPGHGRLDADLGDVFPGGAHRVDHPVRDVRGAEVEADLVQPGLPEGPEVLLIRVQAVGVQVLMHPGLMEPADDAVIFFDFHEGLQVDIGDAGGFSLQGEEQGQILLPVFAAADFPQPLPDGRNRVQDAVIVAEGTAGVAPVRLPDGGQPRAQQAGFAAAGKVLLRPDIQRAGPRPEALQPGNVRLQPLKAGFRRQLDLAENRQGNLLLPAAQGLILRQRREKGKPPERVLLRNLHVIFSRLY